EAGGYDAPGATYDSDFWFIVLERGTTHSTTVRPLVMPFWGGLVGIRVAGSPPTLVASGDWPQTVRPDLSSGAPSELGVQELFFSQTPSGGALGLAAPGTFVNEQLEAGARVLMPGSCDLDAYSGFGQAYPNVPGATVDGGIAALAALDFTVRGTPPSTSAPRYRTGRILLSGGSAGAAGAYNVMFALRHSTTAGPGSFGADGIVPNGLIMDSGTASTHLDDIRAATNSTDENTFLAAFTAKATPEFIDTDDVSEYYPAGTVDRELDVPLFDIFHVDDPACGGDHAPIAGATTAGVTNCVWAHADLAAVANGTTT
ncbi:hypothetical protein B7486_62945, partial [cyanobacterium TDX16]